MSLPEAVDLFLHGLQVLFSQCVGCEEGFIKKQKFLQISTPTYLADAGGWGELQVNKLILPTITAFWLQHNVCFHFSWDFLQNIMMVEINPSTFFDLTEK